MAKVEKYFSVKRSAFWAILLPFLIVVGALAIMLLESQSYMRATDQILRTDRIIADLYELKKYVLDMETGVRGYLLYDFQEEYLQPYKVAKERIKPFTEEVYELIDPALRPRFDELRGKIDIWMKDVQALVEDKDTTSLSSRFKRPGRLNIMRTIRSDIEAFIIVKENLREKRITEHEGKSQRIIYTSILMSLLLLTLISAVVWRGIVGTANSYREILHDLDAANEKLRAQNDSLEATVEARTADLVAINAELEAFCYSVSHDLRAPLRGIDGFSQALIEDYPERLDSKGNQYLHFIREGVQRMGKLIDDLLNLSRISRLDTTARNVDLTEIASSVFAEVAARHPGESRKIVLPKQSYVVQGDPDLLKVAFENLISNAWKFTSKVQEPKIEFGAETKNGKLVFFVRDNGAGFDMKFINKLFGAFQRLHTSLDFPGTGIGLATVKRIMLKHGGDIWAEAKPREGATFFFRLP